MIESNTVDEDTTYFLSGKEIINIIKNIEIPSIEGLVKTTDIENKLKDYVRIDKIVVTDITKTPDFAEYIDLGTGEWKAFPESEKEKVKKLSDKYTAKINE